MIYCDYKFEIVENGLTLVDKGVDLISIEKTPFKAGDNFVLTLDDNGCMFFKRVDIRKDL